MLEDISPLENLSSLGLNLHVLNNALLPSLEGLENMDAGFIIDINIYDNPMLSECDVQSICDYLASPNGTINIHDNDIGCNSQQEVEDACFVNIQEFSIEDYFSISPNPVNTLTQIRFVVSERGAVICDLYEVSGVCVKHCFSIQKTPGEYNLEIEVGDLTKGVYICILKTTEGVFTKKVVKL